MSHNNAKKIKILIMAGLLIFQAGIIKAGSDSSETGHDNIILHFYRTYISGADGSRCPMMPSCSEYAAQAVRKHGLIMGWIMACDRLVRCGRDETQISEKIIVNGRQYTYDPVSANNFWWAEKK